MNHLAHFFLARRTPEALTGALLGDFVKGKISENAFPFEMRDEIIIHRSVDAFTDRDAALQNGKRRIKPPRRRFAGIILDVLFDHFLAANWNDYADESLDVFAARAYRALETNAHRFPMNFQAFLPRMIADDWLAAYRNVERVDFALQRLARRVRGGESLQNAFSEISENYDYFEDCFREFFPRLQTFVAETRKTL